MTVECMLLKPDNNMYNKVLNDIKRKRKYGFLSDAGYITYLYSGKWTGMDPRFVGRRGYPRIEEVFGVTMGGAKPWDYANINYAYPDYKIWFKYYLNMMKDYKIKDTLFIKMKDEIKKILLKPKYIDVRIVVTNKHHNLNIINKFTNYIKKYLINGSVRIVDKNTDIAMRKYSDITFYIGEILPKFVKLLNTSEINICFTNKIVKHYDLMHIYYTMNKSLKNYHLINNFDLKRLIKLLVQDIKVDINEYLVGDNYTKYSYSWKYIIGVSKNDDLIQKYAKKGYLFEMYNTMILNTYIKKSDVVLDIGANVGTMSIPLSKVCQKIYSFEPFLKTYNILKYNIKKNKCFNIIPINRAVGHTNMQTQLASTVVKVELNKNDKKNFKLIPGQSIDEYIKEEKDINYGGIQLGKDGQKIEMITIDSLNLYKIDIIKVDVEGAENLVFYGLLKSIKKFKPIIIFEKNWQTITKDMKESMNLSSNVINFDIFDYCRKLGYNKLIESDREYFILIPSHRKQLINDKMVKFIKVNKLNLETKYSKGYQLYRFIKPKW